MKIEIIKCLEDNFSYLLIDELTKSTIVIDPSEAKPIINKIESLNLKLKFIMNTHHHYDLSLIHILTLPTSQYV